MPEYAYDISLRAVVRMRAVDEVAALRGMVTALDCMDLSGATLDGLSSGLESITITEASLSPLTQPHLFEVDGVVLEEIRETFTTPYEQHRDREGQPFTALRKITEADATHDMEVLPMYVIRFEDGTVIDAWPEEVET